jgi:hypothetical protein
MSLINDALKRAKALQRENPPTGAPPLPPVEPRAPGGAGWMLALAVILFLAAAGLFIGVAFLKRPILPVEVAKAPDIAAPRSSPAKTAPAPTLVSMTVSNRLPAMQDTNPPPAAAPRLLPKVQGIIFNAVHPLAIVNGKAVNVGDHVGDLQVKRILENSIVLQRADGSQETLKLGE